MEKTSGTNVEDVGALSLKTRALLNLKISMTIRRAACNMTKIINPYTYTHAYIRAGRTERRCASK